MAALLTTLNRLSPQMFKNLTPQWAQNATTTGIGIAAVVLGVLGNVGQAPHWIDVPSMTLSLLGMILLWLIQEHKQTAARIQKIEDLDFHSRLQGLSPTAFRKIDNALANYLVIYEIWKDLKRNADATADFVLAVTDEHFDMLQRLSSGKILVPHRQSSHVQHLLLEHVRTRFEAVSDRDLDFWDQTQSDDYHAAIKSAHRRDGLIVNRIFIFTWEEIRIQRKTIARVLEEQQRSGFGWGIAVWDEIPRIHREKKRLDFALSGVGWVLTYFIPLDPTPRGPRYSRDLEIVLPTPANQNEFQRQRDIYAEMIGECWLVNKSFANSSLETLNPKQLEKAAKIATRSNEHVFKKLEETSMTINNPLFERSALLHGETESDPGYFLLLTENMSTIDDDLQRLDAILDVAGTSNS